MTDIAPIGSVVRAKVEPRRRDDLKPGVLPYIGKTLRFRSMGMVGPDVCGGVYADEICMALDDDEEARPADWHWMPLCDLEVVEVIRA